MRFALLAAMAAALWIRRGGSGGSDITATEGSARTHGGGANGSALSHLTDPAVATVRQIKLPVVKPGALRLEGMVIDDEERPVAGVHVAVGAGHEVTTEADGGFAFDGLAEGDYTIIADKGPWYAEKQDVSLDETSEPVTLTLERGVTLRVHVVGPEGAPIAGARVSIISRAYTTPADGIVVLRGAGLDDEYVHVTSPGHAAVRRRVRTGDDPSATIDTTIVLSSGAEITGMVVDARGTPVGDAYVELEPVTGGRAESAWSDDAGVFHLPDIGGGRYNVRASSKTTISAADVRITHDGVHPTMGLVLHVEEGAVIAGVVVDTAGHPIAEARVTGGSVGETTDKDGKFEARGLAAGSYSLSTSTPMLGTVDRSVTVARGQRVEVRIVLVPSSIAGIVVDARGEPVENASVTAHSDSPDGYGFASSDEFGHFDFGGMQPGTYEIKASRDKSRVDGPIVSAATGSRQVRIVVPDRASITGRVVMDGQPVPYFGFAIADNAAEDYVRPTSVRDPDGRFTETDALLGTFAVVIVGPTFERRAVEGVRVVEGQVTDLGDITVQRGAVIRGRVVDARGSAVAGAAVRLVGAGTVRVSTLTSIMRGDRTAITDASGAYEIAGVPSSAESRTLEATHPERGSSGMQVLPAGQTTLDLTLAPTGGIAGTIVRGRRDQDTVIATLAGDHRTQRTADVDSLGAFSFDHLAAGDYIVEVLGKNAVPQQHAAVAGGTTTELLFEMPEHPVELRVHVRGTCDVVSLRTVAGDAMLTDTCDDSGTAKFIDIAPGRYQVCTEDCSAIEVPVQPVVDVEAQGKA